MFLAVTLVVLWPIIPSAYSGDDTFDSFTPFHLKYSDQTPWSFIFEVTRNWVDQQGRFFPGAVTVGTFAHYLFPDRDSYKVLQIAVATLALFAFYLFIRVITRSHHVGVGVSLLALCAMQFKVQYDPILQFSIQQPALMIFLFLSFTCFVFGIRHQSNSLCILSIFLFFIANVTYETSILFWPIFLIIVLIEQPSKWKMKLVTTFIVPAGLALFLLWLRSRVQTTTAGYTSNFDFDSVTVTLGRQLLASMPMSFSEISDQNFLLTFPQHLRFGSWSWLLLMTVSTVLFLSVFPNIQKIKSRTHILLITLGIILWLMPALVVAQTARWQSELQLGNGYITAYQGYFGFSLVAIGLFLQLRSNLNRWFNHGRHLLTVCFCALVLVSISSLFANNIKAVEQYNPGYLWPREHFEQVVKSGLFNSMSSNSAVLSPQDMWWYNTSFIAWYGGPLLDKVVTPKDRIIFDDCVADLLQCRNNHRVDFAFSSFGLDPNQIRTTVIGRIKSFGITDSQLSSLVVTAPAFFIDLPTPAPTISEAREDCETWLVGRLMTLELEMSQEIVQIESAERSSCVATLPATFAMNLFEFSS